MGIEKTEMRRAAITIGKEIRMEEAMNEHNSKKEQAIIHDSQSMDTAELAERYGMDEDDIKIILGYN